MILRFLSWLNEPIKDAPVHHLDPAIHDKKAILVPTNPAAFLRATCNGYVMEGMNVVRPASPYSNYQAAAFLLTQRGIDAGDPKVAP